MLTYEEEKEKLGSSGSKIATGVRSITKDMHDIQIGGGKAKMPAPLTMPPQAGTKAISTRSITSGKLKPKGTIANSAGQFGKQALLSENEPVEKQPIKEKFVGVPVLCAEAKTYWSYKDRVYEDIVNGEDDEGRRFDWQTDKGVSAELLKQVRYKILHPHNFTLIDTIKIWGELYFMDCNWGWASNGRKILIYVRTNPTELVVAGRLLDWDSPHTLETLAGLYFASIDELKRPGLRGYLCTGSRVHRARFYN